MEKKKVWSVSDIIDNRNNWSLANDAELLKHLQFLSEKLFNKSHSILNLLQSFENEVNQTCIAVDNINNRFIALSDTQFIENKVEESPEVETSESEPFKVSQSKSEDITYKLKEALDNGMSVLETHYDIIAITDSDSENEEPQEILLKPRNPYLNRKLPYIIGSDDFTKYDHLGLVDTSSEEEEDEEEEEKEEPEKKIEKEKIKSQPVKIERDLQKFQTQIIRISSSDTEDSDISLSHDEYDKRESTSNIADKNIPVGNAEARSSTQMPINFADHLNTTLKNASSHINRHKEIPLHVDDMFSPPPFPTKDTNSFSSEEEKSDSSNDLFTSKPHTKKSVQNYIPPKSHGMVDDSDDNDDYVTTKSQNSADSHSTETSITTQAKTHEMPVVSASRKSCTMSEISQSGSSASKPLPSNVINTHRSSMKNIENKNIITAINAELNAKLKLQKNHVRPDEDMSGSDDNDAEFESCIVSSSKKKSTPSFDNVEKNGETDVKPDLINIFTENTEQKKVKNCQFASRTKNTLCLFDDDDDDTIDDLFKSSSSISSKTKITIPAANSITGNHKMSKRLFDDDGGLFSIDGKSNEPTGKISKSLNISNVVSAIKKSDLFDDDSDSGDDIFAIINKQKKTSMLPSKAAEKVSRNTVKTRKLFGTDDDSCRKLVEPVKNVYDGNENLLKDEKSKNKADNVSEKIQNRSNLFEGNDRIIKMKKDSANLSRNIEHESEDAQLKFSSDKNKGQNAEKTIRTNTNLFGENELSSSKEKVIDETKIIAKNIEKKETNTTQKFVLNSQNKKVYPEKISKLFEEDDLFVSTQVSLDTKPAMNKNENSSGKDDKLSSAKSSISGVTCEQKISISQEDKDKNISNGIMKDIEADANIVKQFSNSSKEENILTEKSDEHACNLFNRNIEKSISDEIVANKNEYIKTDASSDEQDGNLVDKNIVQQEASPMYKRKSSKLIAMAGLNINVNALLPGSNWSTISKQQKESAQVSPKSIGRSDSHEPVSNLSSIIKERVKISTQRRPQSRRARISKISEDVPFVKTSDIEENTNNERNLSSNQFYSAKSDNCNYLSTTDVKQSITDDLFRGVEDECKAEIEDALNILEKNAPKIEKRLSNIKNWNGESSLLTITEEKPKIIDPSHQFSCSVDEEKKQVDVNSVDQDTSLNLIGMTKDRAVLPKRRPSSRKPHIKTEIRENEPVIQENVSTINSVKNCASNANVKNETSTIDEDLFSMPGTKNPLIKNVDIKNIFEDSDDDEDLFSKLFAKNKSPVDNEVVEQLKFSEVLETSEIIRSQIEGKTIESPKSVEISASVNITDARKIESVFEDTTPVVTVAKQISSIPNQFSSIERKRTGNLFNNHLEETDLFSTIEVSHNSKTLPATNSTTRPFIKEIPKSRLDYLFDESVGEDNAFFAEMRSESKTLTSPPQKTMKTNNTVKNFTGSKTVSTEKPEICDKTKIDLFGDNDDELFSKPKKSIMKSVLAKNTSLFGDNDNEDDLFGVKSSANEKQTTDLFKKSNIPTSIEKQRVVKLRSQTVSENPLSGK